MKDEFAQSGARYARFLQVERQLSPNTVAAYSSDLACLFAFLRERHITTLAAVSAADLLAFLAALAAAGQQAPTIIRRAVAVRQFFFFLVAEGILASDPAAKLPASHRAQRLPRSLPVATVAKLLAACAGSDPHSLRDRAALELLYGTGIRISELCHLTLPDVCFIEDTLRIVGKGDRERIVPFGDCAQQALSAYLSAGRSHFTQGRSSDYLFPGRAGRPITRMALFKRLRLRALQAGLADNIHPHRLRHACATHLLAGGADLRAVAEMLGHASLSSTEIYTHLQPKDLLQCVQRHHVLGGAGPKDGSQGAGDSD